MHGVRNVYRGLPAFGIFDERKKSRDMRQGRLHGMRSMRLELPRPGH